MSQYCYRQPARTVTSLTTSFIRSTSFRTTVFTLPPTGTELTSRLSTTRIASITSFPTEVIRTSFSYTTTCTTYRTSYPYYGSRTRVPTGIIIIAVLAGLWYAVFFGVSIYLLCFSKTAKRSRRPKGQGAFNQNQFQNTQPQQQYTPVPQDSLYSRSDTQYPPQSNLPYAGLQQNPNQIPQQMSYASYQNYNAPNVGAQATTQWATQYPTTPSSFASGPGPGYIPPGAANPMLPSPSAGVQYSTTPSPPPGHLGQPSDPHRLLYTQPNDRLSAAVSLVHPYQQQQPQEQPRLSSYSSTGPPFGQLHQTPSQTQLGGGQYRGYAEPSTFANYNNNNNGKI